MIIQIIPDNKGCKACYSRGKKYTRTDVVCWGLTDAGEVLPMVLGFDDKAVPAEAYGYNWELNKVITETEHKNYIVQAAEES